MCKVLGIRLEVPASVMEDVDGVEVGRQSFEVILLQSDDYKRWKV